MSEQENDKQKSKEDEQKVNDDDKSNNSKENKSTNDTDTGAAIIGGIAAAATLGLALYAIGKGLKWLFSKNEEEKDKDINDYISSHRTPVTDTSRYSRSSNEYVSST